MKVSTAALAALVGLGACASQQPPAANTPAVPPAAAAATTAVGAPAPVKLLSAAEARSLELASMSITSFDRLVANGATLLAKAVPLPIDPAGVRDMLLAQAGMPPEVAANLDLASPIGAVVVSTGAAGATDAVVALAARGPAEAARVLAAVGKQIERRGDFALIDNGTGGRAWVYQDGKVIVFSSAGIEGLARGARLAEEARHAVAEDVTVVVHPDAIARANGTDVKTALAMLMAQMQAAQETQPEATRPSPRALDGVREGLDLLADAQTVEGGLRVEPAKGLSLSLRLLARAASRLEKVSRDAHPYELDGTLLAGTAPPAFVGASSLGLFVRDQMARQREALQASKAKGAGAALAFQDALIAGLGGQVSFAFRIVREAPFFTAEVAYSLKDAAAATAIGNALAKLDKDALRVLAEAQGGAIDMFTWAAKSESVAKLKAIHVTVQLEDAMGLPPDVKKKVFGGKGIDAYAAVAGTRLVTTIGRDAKGDLGRVAAAKPAAPAGALADTLAATKGRDSFFHLDLAPVLSLVGTFVKDKKTSAIVAAAKEPLPIVTSGGGDGAGKMVSYELWIPASTFVNAGGVVRAGMAGGMGGGEPEKAAPEKKKGKKK